MQQTTDQIIDSLFPLAEQAAGSTDESLVNSEFAAKARSMRGDKAEGDAEVTAEQAAIRAIFGRLLEQNRGRIESTPYLSLIHI